MFITPSASSTEHQADLHILGVPCFFFRCFWTTIQWPFSMGIRPRNYVSCMSQASFASFQVHKSSRSPWLDDCHGCGDPWGTTKTHGSKISMGWMGLETCVYLGIWFFCGFFLARRLDGMNGTRNLCMRIKYGTYGTDGTSCWRYSMIVGFVQLETSRYLAILRGTLINRWILGFHVRGKPILLK